MTSKWTTIRVPKELADLLKKMSEEKGMAYWKVIMNAISWYNAVAKDTRRRDEIPLLDKISWYIVKLSYSVSKFKDEPSENNLNWLTKMVGQIYERLKVDVSYILRTAKAYMESRSKDDLIELNMAWKMAITDIIYYGFLKNLPEEEEK